MKLTRKILLIIVSLPLMFGFAQAEEKQVPRAKMDLCAAFIPSDLSQAIAHREMNNLCIIEASELSESIKYDKKELVYNPASKENQLIFYNGPFLALIVDRDLFYIIEEGNETSRAESRSVVRLMGATVALQGLWTKKPTTVAAGVLIIQYAEAFEDVLFYIDRRYDLGIYDKEEDVKRDKVREKAPKARPTRYVYGNDGRMHFSDGTSAPVIIYDPPPKQHDYEESWG